MFNFNILAILNPNFAIKSFSVENISLVRNKYLIMTLIALIGMVGNLSKIVVCLRNCFFPVSQFHICYEAGGPNFKYTLNSLDFEM
jgi:hypothetical protein